MSFTARKEPFASCERFLLLPKSDSRVSYFKSAKSVTFVTFLPLSRRVVSELTLILTKALLGKVLIWFHHDSAHKYRKGASLCGASFLLVI